MKPRRQMNHFSNLRKAVSSAFLVVAILAAFLPQPVQAAVTCRAYHFVREGDTTPYIAHTYGVKWGEIAAANKMNPADKLTVGQRLCIPPAEGTSKRPVLPATDKNASVTITIAGGKIFLNLAKFSVAHVYLVKARNVDVGIGGWSRIGLISVPKNKSLGFTFNVPKDLTDIPQLNVCLKDMTTDELICRTAINP